MTELILWDIDGTLTRGRLVVGAYNRALRAVYRLEGELARVDAAGKTDQQIALETLALHDWREEEIRGLLPAFRAAYVAEVERQREELARDLVVLPGAPRVLEELARRGVRQTLLTGNFEEVARLKLAVVGLEHYFDFRVGAFGSDHHDRNCYVPIALTKLSQTHGVSVAPSEVLVIGDTPRDIACARAHGARVISVATGQYSARELARHQPDALLENLADVEAALREILPGDSLPVSFQPTM